MSTAPHCRCCGRTCPWDPQRVRSCSRITVSLIVTRHKLCTCRDLGLPPSPSLTRPSGPVAGGPGGAILHIACSFAILNSHFDCNRASTFGGALAAGNRLTPNSTSYVMPSVTFVSCSFTDNRAMLYDGGALLIREMNATVYVSTFTTNQAGRNGGAVVSCVCVGVIELLGDLLGDTTARRIVRQVQVLGCRTIGLGGLGSLPTRANGADESWSVNPPFAHVLLISLMPNREDGENFLEIRNVGQDPREGVVTQIVLIHPLQLPQRSTQCYWCPCQPLAAVR